MPEPREQQPGDTEKEDGPTLSLIIPAYNESQRLPPYLAAVERYLCERYGDRYEVIVVDDGSDDGMAELLTMRQPEWRQLRMLQHATNQGKGAAVRSGVSAAEGKLILYADADGATPIEEEDRLRQAIDRGADIAVGSRLVSSPSAVCHRSPIRGLVGRSFATLARFLLRLPVRDTQCGFKMLRGSVARALFDASEERGYLFDLEILALATKSGYCVTEVAINWSDQPGSRLSMLRECGKILGGLVRIRRRLASRDFPEIDE